MENNSDVRDGFHGRCTSHPFLKAPETSRPMDHYASLSHLFLLLNIVLLLSSSYSISFLMMSVYKVCWEKIHGNHALLGAVLIPVSTVTSVKTLLHISPKYISTIILFFLFLEPLSRYCNPLCIFIAIYTVPLIIHERHEICMKQMQIIQCYHQNW